MFCDYRVFQTGLATTSPTDIFVLLLFSGYLISFSPNVWDSAWLQGIFWIFGMITEQLLGDATLPRGQAVFMQGIKDRSFAYRASASPSTQGECVSWLQGMSRLPTYRFGSSICFSLLLFKESRSLPFFSLSIGCLITEYLLVYPLCNIFHTQNRSCQFTEYFYPVHTRRQGIW